MRWLKLLGARAEVAGRQVELLFLVRENVNGQCFLERVTERGIVRRRRDSGGGLPNGDATAAAGVDTGAPPELDIFVGGAGDASKGLVSGYRDSYSKRYGRNTQYFSWKDMDGILNAIRTAPPGTNVNVIAHSYGANAAALGIGMMAPTGLRVSRFISIDPVGRSPIPPEFRNAVGSWINVTSAPTTSDDSDKAAILGGKGGRLPTDQADIDYNVATNHENFSAMMTAPSPQGVSAEKMLVDGGWPQQQNPRLGEPFGGF